MNSSPPILKKIFFIGLIIVACLPSFVLSQTSIKFNHLTVKEGLSQSSVNCILQDKMGFLWFGTQDGLNRYDGYKCKVFKNNPTDSTSLKENFILSIYEDNNGILYVETRNGYIQKYNNLTENFSDINRDSVDYNSFKVSAVLPTLIDKEGYHWVVSGGKENGLLRFNPETKDSTWFKHSESDKGSISADKVYSVYQDKSGTIWIGTFNGLDKYIPETNSFAHFRQNPNNPYSISDNWVWPIFEDSRGVLWIGTVRGGLNSFDRKTGKFYSYKNEPTNPNSINSNFILSIYEDEGGVIWVGTSDAGLNSFHPASNYFEHYINDPKNKNSISDNSVLSMLVDKKGITWIGTRNKGLDRFDHATGKFINYSHKESDVNTPSGNSIPVLFEDHLGIIWLGTFSKGLNSFDPSTNKFKKYQHDPNNPNSISDNRVYSIYEDKDEVLWVGTYGGGLNKFNRTNGTFSSFQNSENDTTSLSANSVISIREDKERNLWVGTFGGGLNKFNRKNKSFKHYKHSDSNTNSISDNIIVTLFEDSKSNLWIGTSNGLNKYNSKDDTFKYYNEKDGLPNDVIFGILEDIEGDFWISTNNGLTKFNPTKETFRNYYVSDGLQGNEFNQNAYAQNKITGEIYLGGNNGFNVFQPAKVKDNVYIPPVVFSTFKRYNTDNKDGKAIEEKGISVRDTISLSYKDNIIEFDISALSFNNSAKNQYKYKLVGFNENWIQMGTNHSIIFTNLSHGEYNLLVKGSNNDGVWNETGTSLYIKVTPPWWRTNIAYAMYLFLIIVILFTVRKVEMNIQDQKAQIRENELLIIAGDSEKRALRIENERKTKELEEARNLQLSMLPREIPKIGNLDIAVFMRTATEVGGDYYDFLTQEDGTLNIAFGDATGHGLQAGTMVTLIKGMFMSLASKLDIKSFMDQTNKAVKQIKLGRILMAFTFLKFIDNKIEMSGAGMPPVYLYRKATSTCEEIVLKGMPLGAMFNAPFYIEERELNSGDCILLLTDGLPEQMNGKEEMYDYPQVLEKFIELAENKPQEIIDALVKSCDDWMEDAIQEDDISFIVLKIS